MRTCTLVMVAILLPTTMQTTSAQTLEETAAFVLTGGEVELEMTPSDADGFRRWTSDKYFTTRSVSTLATFAPVRMKVDVVSCSVRFEGNASLLGSKELVGGVQEFYLNNVILNEMRESNSFRSPGKILVFTGELTVVCSNFDNRTSGHPDCDEKSKSFQIYVSSEKRERFDKAVAYLYSKYCKSAVRKSAY
jgi:hypothetical protein